MMLNSEAIIKLNHSLQSKVAFMLLYFKQIYGSTLIRSSSIYTVSSILNAAIPFLVMPVLTRYLSPAEYGLTATFQVLVGFIAPFTGLSIHGAIARKYYDKDAVDMPKYIANCLVILLISSLVVSAVFWVFVNLIVSMTFFPREWLWAVVIVSVGQFISLVTLTVWQVQRMPLQYGSFKMALTLLNIGISLWLIVYIRMNWQGSVWAQVLVGIISIISGLGILWKNGWIKLELDYLHITSALKFGIPLIPHALGGWIMVATDRIFINKMVGIADTGIYTVGFQIAMIVGLIETSFNTAWVPWLYEKLKQDSPDTNLKIVKFTYLYVFSIFIFAFALTLIAPSFVSFFVGNDFKRANEFIFWLAMARAMEAMYFMTCNYIFYSSRTSFIAFATFIASIIHILAMYLLIKINGTIGAAQATFISSFISVVLTWWFASRLHKMPWLLGWSK